MSSQSLFLVSTPLHLLVSLAIIGKEKIDSPHLIFIDQDPNLEAGFRGWLNTWPDSPFTDVQTLFRPPKKALAKGKARKETFAFIKAFLSNKHINRIYVGNDRRVEFQYAMHIANQNNSSVHGVYMDEGIFTYAGRTASKSLNDKVIDGTLKKIAYGWWWSTPATIGASHWINEVYASIPEFVHPLLKSKQLHALDEEYWNSPLLQSYCAFALADSMANAEELLDSIDILITLPHESILYSDKFDNASLVKLIAYYRQQKKVIAVKYHPRDKQEDALELKEQVDHVLPQALPFEAMLPCLKESLSLFGELSTPLVTAKLLRPSFNVSTFSNDNTSHELKLLFDQLEIKSLKDTIQDL